MKRNNKDCERCNLFGKTLVELCCVHNMHIMNARLHDDVDGNFTCLTAMAAVLWITTLHQPPFPHT